jgi:hypothetical protein
MAIAQIQAFHTNRMIGVSQDQETAHPFEMPIQLYPANLNLITATPQR